MRGESFMSFILIQRGWRDGEDEEEGEEEEFWLKNFKFFYFYCDYLCRIYSCLCFFFKLLFNNIINIIYIMYGFYKVEYRENIEYRGIYIYMCI